ncbi:hypothetical protein Sdiek1_2360 [Sulfurospirillum diekertiae]|uniref:Uncharacterized protein n=2 Tax=Sulfurospirillum diekertiae TaxID=1854492 RepID=A0A1Y0HNH9_9BACT|nr:hypothetical protein [Sulfurospirillum diekertiae]ARU49510.1 hypothetical protein Sdiek1_2360 [Sulfurospirillum diekertiae]
MIYLLSNRGEKNIALRFSEFEGIDTILCMKNNVKWVWIDCFSKLPITQESYHILKQNGFKICLVSPELQSQDSKLEVYKQYLNDNAIIFDAICTKNHCIRRWM